jgi:alpha-galactosidase
MCFLAHVSIAQKKVIVNIKNSPSAVYLSDNSLTSAIKVARKWTGNFCATTLTNNSKKNLRIKEVVLMQAARQYAPDTKFYAEGFQMLSQYKGTLAAPGKVGSFDDNKHYKIPEPQGYKAVYNMLILHGINGDETLMGFNSSYRFIGKFYLSADTVKVVMDMDNVELKAGATIKLEEFSLLSGKDVNELTGAFAQRINYFHPRLKKTTPAGWCSWYCFGPEVTAKNITDNLVYIKNNIPQLKYIQLDDGYQPHMGDWLETGAGFGSNIKTLLKQIKQNGFEPAIWVAPFICDSNSSIFKQHSDWLVKDSAGHPLRSDKVSFGGWRLAPWYVLDGTNPAVQQHLKKVFRTMSKDWGCTYFKLDANFWGAIQGGFYYDKNATRVTAYRSGMKAILEETGDAFILGCNHPLWPSLGLIHGSRSSNDIFRNWNNFKKTGEENIMRIWQNGKLWWNDPDCVLLTGNLSDNEYMYHASLLFATGGMILSGDDLTTISAGRLEVLKKMLPPTGAATSFNNTLDIGWMKAGKSTFLILLNKDDTPKKISVTLPRTYTITNYWTGKKAGVYNKIFNAGELPPHSGQVFKMATTVSKL